MEKYADYMILPEFSLILECCSGEALVEDAINMKKAELSDILYNPNYNIIVDFRKFEAILDPTLKESASNFFHFLKGINMRCKIVILTAAPHQVVVSVILRELSNSLGSVIMEVFSTVDAALRFLGIPIENFNLINNKILELNKTSI